MKKSVKQKIKFNREELVLIWQALELKTATMRCCIDTRDLAGAQKAGVAIRRNVMLSRKIHENLNELTREMRKLREQE